MELPFFQKTQTSAPAEEEATAVSAPAVIQTEDPVHVLLVSPSAIDDGTAVSQAATAGCTGIAVEMKEASGALSYVSTLSLAEDSGASAADPNRNEAIRTLNLTPGLHTVAIVSCFRDSAAADQNPGMAFTRVSGSLWRDGDSRRWLNPASSEARAYLCGVCRELADLGFDEILLTNAGYPGQGNLSLLQPTQLGDMASRIQWVDVFYKEVRDALKPCGVTLSVMTEGTVTLLGANPDTGQTLNDLTDLADRVWLDDAGSQDVTLFGAGGLSDPEVNLVSVGTEPGTANRSWAVFAPTEYGED